MFTRAEMNEHIARSGKNISDIQNHSVPTSLRNAYYAQVQGQIGVTGAKWCDFITYTSKGIYIEKLHLILLTGRISRLNFLGILLNIF